jgi:hypothetical protein
MILRDREDPRLNILPVRQPGYDFFPIARFGFLGMATHHDPKQEQEKFNCSHIKANSGLLTRADQLNRFFELSFLGPLKLSFFAELHFFFGPILLKLPLFF